MATSLLLPLTPALGASPGDTDETLRVQAAVVKLANSICKDPPAYGLTVNGQGKITGSLSVPKVLKAIGADGTVSASLGGGITYWRGIQQDQIASANTARNSCALQGARLLFHDLEFTSLVSGKKIPAPKDYAKLVSTYAAHNTTVVASPTQNVSGNGNLTVGGNAIFGAPPAAPDYMALGSMCEPAAWVPVEVTEFSPLSNSVLRNRVRLIGTKLRDIQKDFDAHRVSIFNSPQYRQEDMNALNESFVTQMDANHLRDRAQRAEVEMIERIGGHLPHGPSDGLTLAGQEALCGQLNTPHGLADLADYLDALAALLPA